MNVFDIDDVKKIELHDEVGICLIISDLKGATIEHDPKKKLLTIYAKKRELESINSSNNDGE